MSGYIGNLLGRTLGDAPLLRPRAPSVFEPVAEPAADLQSTWLAAPPSVPPVESRPVLSAVPSRETAPEPPSAPRPRLDATLPDPPPPMTAPEPHAHESTPPLPRARKQEAATPHEPARPGLRIATPPVLPSVRPAPSTDRATANVEPLRAVRPGTSTGPEPAPAAPAHLQAPPPLALRPAAAAALHTSRPPVLPRGPLPSRESRVAPRLAARVPLAPEPAAEPGIRVTIGRVDVRAVVAPQTQSRATRSEPAPRLSLDDYLRSRDGGRR